MRNLRQTIIFFFDFISFFAALFLTLALRYQTLRVRQLFLGHLKLFLVFYILWLAISYIFDLWQPKSFKNQTDIFGRLAGAVTVFFAAAAVILFFLGQFFAVSPKTNLLIFSAFLLALDYFGHIVLKNIFAGTFKVFVLFLEKNKTVEYITATLKEHSELGYVPLFASELGAPGEINRNGKDMVVIFPNSITNSKSLRLEAYRAIFSGADIVSLSDFYERIFLKEPLESINEMWFIENIKIKKGYQITKRIFDIFLSIGLLIVLFPIMLLLALCVLIFDRNPRIFYKQIRKGENNKDFVLYKFETMVPNNGPVWCDKDDKRITSLGKFLRATHMDEFPQLYNILKGDISFVGPRPEQAKVVEMLSEKIPFYDVRHIVKPGLTGWAQLHYKASASIEESGEKLRYDLYYVKNRSMLLDLMVLLKTFKLFFINPK